MPQATRTFRLFVSSTFSDLKQERSALQTYVFPRLRELAQAHGCRFQAIDLRWGVSEEAALDQQTMKICLTEIERCQKVSPRPNFLILLGDRFGWRPLPYAIPAQEFEILLPFIPNELRPRLEWRADQPEDAKGWYRRDENALPAEYVLQPRQKGSRFEVYETWESEVEHPLVTTLERAARQAGLSPETMVKYTHSATGQEIVRGAMAVDNAPEHVFAYFRTIANPAEAPADSKIFFEADRDLAERQARLKETLKERLPGHVHEFEARWQSGSLSADHTGSLPGTLTECLELIDQPSQTETMCLAIWQQLARLILDEVSKLKAVDALEREQEAHIDFARQRAHGFVGRQELLARIADYVTGNEHHPLVVWGVSGSGKSALMAKVLEQFQNRTDHCAILIPRFSGATPDSTSGVLLLENLCRQIRRAFSEDESELPVEFREMARELPKQMAQATPEKPLVLILDALDQLTGGAEVRDLSWLPTELPSHVKLVLTTLPGDPLKKLQTRLPAAAFLEVAALSEQDGEKLLQGWLVQSRRSLTEEQRSHIVAKFVGGGGLPLYLKLSFEQARHWHSYDDLQILAEKGGSLAGDIPGAIRAFFKRLEQESNHGQALVRRTLGYLAAAKNGLSEDELLDLLWQEAEVRRDFFHRSPKSPQDIHSLPVVIWARLYFDLEPYLTWRKADGSELTIFYHRQVSEAAQGAYLDKDHHAALAGYFSHQALYMQAGENVPNLRKLSEMVFQQAKAGLAGEVESNLLAYGYLEAKLAGLGILELIEDYNLVPTAGAVLNRQALTLLQATLRLSAHVLSKDAAQLPSQLTGRLVGFAEEPIRELLAQVRREVKRPWLRPLQPCFEIPGGELVRTLEGHTSGVNDVLATKDGQFISSSDDRTIKVWDLERGVCLHTLRGYSRQNQLIKLLLTPDGKLIASGESRGTLKVWDLETGTELFTLDGHIDAINQMSLACKGRFLLSRCADEKMIGKLGADRNLNVWDLQRGTCVHQLFHLMGVFCMAVTNDGRRVLTGSGWNIQVWDVESGDCLRTIENPKGFTLKLVMLPDGRRVISSTETRLGKSIIDVWDLETGECQCTFPGSAKFILPLPDSRRAILYDGYKEPEVWDLETGQLLFCLSGHSAQLTFGIPSVKINDIKITHAGRRAVTASNDKTLKVWDLETGACLHTLAGHIDGVFEIVLTPDGKSAISRPQAVREYANEDNALKVWDLDTSACLQTLASHSRRISAMTPAPDGQALYTGDEAGAIKIWRLGKRSGRLAPQGHSREIRSLQVSGDGRRAYSWSLDKTVRVWDVDSGECLRIEEGLPELSSNVAFSPDERVAVFGATDYSIVVWDLEDGKVVRSLTGHVDHWMDPRATAGRRVPGLGYEDPVKVVVFLPDGHRIISAAGRLKKKKDNLLIAKDNLNTTTIKVWDLETGACLHTMKGHRDAIYALAVSADGSMLVSGANDGKIKVWDLESWKCRHTFEGSRFVLSDEKIFAFERNEKFTSHLDLRVWDLASGKCLLGLDKQLSFGETLAVSSRENLVVSATWDGLLKVWQLEQGREVADLRGTANFTCAWAAEDGAFYLAGGKDGRLYFLRLENTL